jgi:hypothetical protein
MGGRRPRASREGGGQGCRKDGRDPAGGPAAPPECDLAMCGDAGSSRRVAWRTGGGLSPALLPAWPLLALIHPARPPLVRCPVAGAAVHGAHRAQHQRRPLLHHDGSGPPPGRHARHIRDRRLGLRGRWSMENQFKAAAPEVRRVPSRRRCGRGRECLVPLWQAPTQGRCGASSLEVPCPTSRSGGWLTTKPHAPKHNGHGTGPRAGSPFLKLLATMGMDGNKQWAA